MVSWRGRGQARLAAGELLERFALKQLAGRARQQFALRRLSSSALAGNAMIASL